MANVIHAPFLLNRTVLRGFSTSSRVASLRNGRWTARTWKAMLLGIFLFASALPICAATIDPSKPVRQLPTAEQIQTALRKGLFIRVTEGGTMLLSAEPKAPVKGALSVALATLGAFDKAEPLMKEAEAAKEPGIRVLRANLEALQAQKAGKQDVLTNACLRAIREDGRHPLAYHTLARAALDRKDFPRAEMHALEAIAFEPEMSPAHMILGVARHAQGKREAAAAALRKAIEFDTFDARPRMALGALYAEAGSHLIAANIYREVVAMNAGLVQARERMALSLLEGGRIDDAVKTAEEVVKLQPQSVQGHYCLALAKLRTHKLGEATDHLNSFSDLAPNAPEGHYLRGLARAMKQDLKGANTAFERAMELSPSQQGIATARAIMDHIAGDLASATNRLSQALRGANPALADRIHFHLGLVALDLRDWAGAQAWFGKTGQFISNLRGDLLDWKNLYQKAPQKSLGQTSLGALLLADKLGQGAMEVFKKAIKNHDQDVLALLLGSSTAARTGESDLAVEWLGKLSKLQPGYWPAHFAMADVMMTKKDLGNAAASLNRTLELDPLNQASYLRLLGIHRDQGDLMKADQVARMMVAKMPQDPVGYNELAALLADRKDKLDEALAHINQALKMEPSNGLYRDTLGWVHYQRGAFAEAEKQFREAVKSVPNHAEIQYHLGLALLKTGKPQEAAGPLREVIALAPGSPMAKEAEALLPKPSQAATPKK